MLNVKSVRDGIFRGPRPQDIADLGWLRDTVRITRVINLQGWVLEEPQVLLEATWAGKLGMVFKHIPMDLLNAPTPEQLRSIASEVRGMRNNVYVHCHDGVDRTGMVCATLKYQDGGVTIGEVIGDMIDEGFHLDVYDFWLKQLKGI
jgi:protein tyrosine phosphatase (PTP) superfamily phosphohydrolase (DUF442 family)